MYVCMYACMYIYIYIYIQTNKILLTPTTPTENPYLQKE